MYPLCYMIYVIKLLSLWKWPSEWFTARRVIIPRLQRLWKKHLEIILLDLPKEHDVLWAKNDDVIVQRTKVDRESVPCVSQHSGRDRSTWILIYSVVKGRQLSSHFNTYCCIWEHCKFVSQSVHPYTSSALMLHTVHFVTWLRPGR